MNANANFSVTALNKPFNTISIKLAMLSLALAFSMFFVSAVDADAEFKVLDVSAAQAMELLQNDPEIKILDVRTGFEFNRGHLKDAINLNYYSRKFKDELSKLDKNTTWLVHCRSGVRSSKTMPIMKRAGFTNIIHLTGGINDWNKAGLPVIK